MTHEFISFSFISCPRCHMARLISPVPISYVPPGVGEGEREGEKGDGEREGGRKREGERRREEREKGDGGREGGGGQRKGVKRKQDIN